MTDKSKQNDETPEEKVAAQETEDTGKAGDVRKAKPEPKVKKKDKAAEQLAEAQKKADEYLDMARRLQADFDNFRKRSQRDFDDYKKYASSALVSDLLTIVDDLDRALSQAEEDTVFVQGIRGVRSNLMKVLEANGLQEIPSEGKFDPNLHEALCMVEGEEDDMIAEVFQKGYTINGKVLRTSKVKVTKTA